MAHSSTPPTPLTSDEARARQPWILTNEQARNEAAQDWQNAAYGWRDRLVIGFVDFEHLVTWLETGMIEGYLTNEEWDLLPGLRLTIQKLEP